MEIIETKIKDLLVIKPDVFTDERGYFFECYNKARFAEHGLDMDFVQDNESQSMKGVLRGLHFQKPPFAQGKLVVWKTIPCLPTNAPMSTTKPRRGASVGMTPT